MKIKNSEQERWYHNLDSENLKESSDDLEDEGWDEVFSRGALD